MSENVTFRSENKYLLPLPTYAELRGKVAGVLHQDNEAVAQKYMVRSLYFDALNNQDYEDKLAGVEERKKIRLRVYTPDAERAKLEIKRKNGDLQRKTSIWMASGDARELTKGRYRVLRNYFGQSPEVVRIYADMMIGAYQPKVLVEYEREAYTYPHGRTRITFDTNLRSSESNFDIFQKQPKYSQILNEMAVLEVKYEDSMPDVVARLLQPYQLERTALSKYVLSRRNFYEFDG